MLADYHLHSHVSHDGRGRIEEHVRRAAEIGLTEICFTEHLDFYPSADGLSCATIPSTVELERYLEEVRYARGRGPVRLRAGVELDYRPETDRWVRELLSRFSFDFVLGSVHNVGRWSVSGPKEMALAFFDERGVEGGCQDYYEVVEQAVATGLFDSFAHLDLMKRFRPQNGTLILRGALRDRIFAILDRMAATGTGIEINGSGLIHDAREAYPSLELLKLARERGVATLTVGSDSHRPETVGRHLAEALDLARAAGFSRFHTFESRVPAAVPI
ncbi:MAG: histidinol-phosphatase [Actinobacteria bacterium]|nr:histidinol-phosphatase [Actinomycetota bacterium]